MDVAIVNYGMGNLRSVANAIEVLGRRCSIVDQPAGLSGARRIILPGVGAFGQAMTRLQESGFVAALGDAVLGHKTPFLGICLGMQLLATRGFEHGDHQGLGWIEGEVRPIPASTSLRVPHMGWNTVRVLQESPLLKGLPPDPVFYFVHSFHHVPASADAILGDTEYGDRLSAVIGKGHIFGTQFHPEKSQGVGLQVLRNFLELGN